MILCLTNSKSCGKSKEKIWQSLVTINKHICDIIILLVVMYSRIIKSHGHLKFCTQVLTSALY